MKKMKIIHYIAISNWQGMLVHTTRYAIKARVLKDKEDRLLGNKKKA